MRIKQGTKRMQPNTQLYEERGQKTVGLWINKAGDWEPADGKVRTDRDKQTTDRQRQIANSTTAR